jgi:hypothetical protein
MGDRNGFLISFAVSGDLSIRRSYFLQTGVRIINLSCHEVEVSGYPKRPLESGIELSLYGSGRE